MSDERKVHDLTIRRRQQMQDHPVLRLADELTKTVARYATEMLPADQLVSIELTARAVLETLKHARGEAELNQIIVEYQNKCRFYGVQWPEHDQSKTVYDKGDEPAPSAVIVSLRREEVEET